MSSLTPWNQIKDQYTQILVLGNGASLAVDKVFNYRSLKEVAERNHWITQNISKVFNYLKTEDFELVLNMLRHTSRINRALEISENRSQDTYNEIKDALIRTVRKAHVSYEKITDYLPQMWKFMYRFRTVVSLNYDLLVYWAMLAGNNSLGRCFKDCFVDGEFQYDGWNNYRNTINGCDHSTLVFYPHGNLCLASNDTDSDMKIVAGSDENLLEAVLNTWRSGEAIPLFVSEGTSRQKIEAIGRSPYLNAVYKAVLPQLEGSVLIYGWSMSDNDEHLIRGLIKPSTESVAISVHTRDKTERDVRDTCELLTKKIRKYSQDAEVTFFDAEDPDCWVQTEA